MSSVSVYPAGGGSNEVKTMALVQWRVLHLGSFEDSSRIEGTLPYLRQKPCILNKDFNFSCELPFV